MLSLTENNKILKLSFNLKNNNNNKQTGALLMCL